MGVINDRLHRLARLCGVDYRRYSKENWVCLRRAHILTTCRIDLVLDIGANRGSYVRELRSLGYKGKAVSFEPLEEAYAALRQAAKGDEQWACENLAIGNMDGNIEINLSARESSSSLLRMAPAHLAASPEARTLGSRTVSINRLDTVLARLPLTAEMRRAYIKADVQGFEKEVLKGAVETLKRTVVVELELSLRPLYEDAPLMDEMISYMGQLGFIMVSFETVFSDSLTGYVLQGDAIFVRDDRQA